MNPEAMSYTGPSQWNWNVSLDGHTFTQTSTGVSGTEESTSEYRNFVEYKVTALNDDFEPIFVEKYQEGSYKVSTDSEDEDPFFQKYLKLQKLAEGTYGVVWKGKCTDTNQLVAIKIFKNISQEGLPSSAVR